MSHQISHESESLTARQQSLCVISAKCIKETCDGKLVSAYILHLWNYSMGTWPQLFGRSWFWL